MRDRSRIFRLRYEIYIEEMGRSDSEADHDNRLVRDSFDENAHLLLAEDDGHIVGTIRLNLRSAGEIECESLYDLPRFGDFYPDRVSMTTRLMVCKNYRNTSVAAKLAMAAYDLARQHGIQFDFIDCNPHLVRLYQQLGHRFYRPTIEHPDYGTVIPMVMVLEDVDYFNRIRSPFRRIQNRYPNSSAAAEFFRNEFHDYASIFPSFTSTGSELMEMWRSSLDGTNGSNRLTRGLSDEDVTQILHQFDSLDYGPGDLIIRQGEESQGMFLLLEGSAAVLVSSAGQPATVVDLLHTGEVFGEMGLVTEAHRNATVRAEEATRVLLLSRAEFTKLKKSRPDIAVQLFDNLFCQVAERFDKVQRRALRGNGPAGRRESAEAMAQG